MRIAVIAALVVSAALIVTVALIGSESDSLSEPDIHAALDESGLPVRYLDTDYEGDGTVVAAVVQLQQRQAQVLVASDVDLQVARQSVDWNRRPGSAIAMGERGDNDLTVWISDYLSSDDFWSIVDALCIARKGDAERCEGI